MTTIDFLGRCPARSAGASTLIEPGREWRWAALREAVARRADALTQERREGEVRAAGRATPFVMNPDAEGVVNLLALWRAGAVPAPLNPALTRLEREGAVAGLRDAGLPGGTAAVLWTSGSTGRPRGVALSLEALLASARAARERLELGPDDVWLASLSPAHVGGLALLTRALLLGSRLVLTGPFDAARAARSLRGAYGIPVTHLSVVPTQLRRLLDLWGPEPPPPTLRCVLVGGAHAPGALVERAHAAGWPLALTYGMTETTSQVATAPPSLTRSKAGTLGPPLPGLRLRIAPSGEILVRGHTLALGRVGPGAGPLVDGDGWYHTGDLGRLDADGHLWVTGRRSDRIVSGGVTVEAQEVEAELVRYPGVAAACVVGLPDEEWGERVGAALVWSSDDEGELADLELWCRERLSAAKRPRTWQIVDALPTTATGKVDRAAVARLFDPAPADEA